MFRVFNYVIPLQNYFSFEIPKGAKILNVLVHGGTPQLFVLIDWVQAPVETRRFLLVGPGQQIVERDIDYIGSFQLHDPDVFIRHLFEIKK